MWIRSGFWDGRPVDGEDGSFRRSIDTELAPAMRKMPGVRSVRVLWPQEYEDRDTNLYCQIITEFDDRQGMVDMLASPEREEVRKLLVALLPAFAGGISHINYHAE